MATTRLIEDAEFKELLPWAKAMAQAQQHTHLEPKHFVQAARMFMVERGWGVDSPELAAALAAVDAATLPKVDAGFAATMPLSDDLKLSLTIASTARAWLLKLLRKKPSQTEASPSVVDGPDAVLQALMPWLRGAMRHHQEEALTTRAMAHGVLAALAAPALDAHPDFRHWCHGHADELLHWLKHTSTYHEAIEPVLDGSPTLSLSLDMESALSEKVNPNEHAPTPVWRWLHAAVAEANQHARLLQVAYHEAGHAVANHVLTPEFVIPRATIVPNGNAAGSVAYDMNTQFLGVYQYSLEYLKERVVVCLAGRAAEEKQFGVDRVDPGAISDMNTATELAWQGITAFGMDEVFGPLSLKTARSLKTENYSVRMAPIGWLHDLAQQRLNAWMVWGMKEARRLVNAHWAQVDRLALALMAQKTMSNADVRAVLGAGGAEFELTDIPGLPPSDAPRQKKII